MAGTNRGKIIIDDSKLPDKRYEKKAVNVIDKPKLPRGRPKVVFGEEVTRMIEELSYVNCPAEEIASVVGITLPTLKKDKTFQRIHEEKKNQGKAKLRAVQFKQAESGNISMLQFLGKNYLDQADKSEVKNTGAVKIVLGREVEELCK